MRLVKITRIANREGNLLALGFCHSAEDDARQRCDSAALPLRALQ